MSPPRNLEVVRARATAVPSEGPSPAGDEHMPSLLGRARAGDVQAWSRLYQEHFDQIFRHIVHLTGDPDIAEDLVQETFAKAIVALPSFRGEAKLSTWLSGIAINIVRAHWRRVKGARKIRDGLARLEEITPQQGDSPDHARLRKARAEVLYTVLEGLPETLREVFILRDLEQLSAREASAQLGITEGNVNVRASRARRRVRDELERLGWLSPRERSRA